MGAEPIPSDAPSRTPVKSAARVLDVLEALAATPDGLGFSALATALELPKSSLHELLGVLTDRGYVAFDAPRRVYALGIRAEYAHIDDAGWRTGRAAVVTDLLGRDPLFATDPGRRRWQPRARANPTAELATLR